MHPCESAEQVADADVLVHTLPTALHTGSALHVHAEAPAVPVQLWCVPHATGAG